MDPLLALKFSANRLFQAFVLTALGVSLSGCLPSDVTEGDTRAEIKPPAATTPGSVDPENTVCDPFNTPPAQPDQGVLGKLFYLSDDQPRASNVSGVMDIGHELPALLYFNRLNIPTRPFDRGFYTQSGDLVSNANGDAIYEYFGLKLNTQLKLMPEDPVGDYQMAILSDDGAVLSVSQNGSTQVLVNNDGTHPTKMSCASQPITLDRNTRIDTELLYHQGPRFHIALVVMWRPWPTVASGIPVNDIECGRSGNSYFFDSSVTPPRPQARYYEMLERGWKVLNTGNYGLPSEDTNPCVPAEDPLEIFDVGIVANSQTAVTMTWETNVSANSKVIYKNVNTGVVLESSLDPAQVRSHSLQVTGLTSNTLYSFQAISTTAGGQIVTSDEKVIRTLR